MLAEYERFFRDLLWPSKRNLAIFSQKQKPINNNEDPKKKSFYYYIGEGDFDLAWPNVAVFIVGHLVMLSTLPWIFSNGVNYYTILWGESFY